MAISRSRSLARLMRTRTLPVKRLEIGGKAARCGPLGIARDLGGVGRVLAPQSVGLSALRASRDRVDIERGQHAGRRHLVAEERGVADALDRDEARLREA